jgi:hypothetical protein
VSDDHSFLKYSHQSASSSTLTKKKSSEFVPSVNSDYSHVKKKNEKMDTAETHILRAVTGYQLIHHKCTEDMKEFQIPDINTIIKKLLKRKNSLTFGKNG